MSHRRKARHSWLLPPPSFPMLCQPPSKTLAVCCFRWQKNKPKTIFYVFERRKITFKADDLCCVPVLNNSPTYWGPLDSSAIVGIARGWHAFVLQDNDYRSLGNGKEKNKLSSFAGEVSAEAENKGGVSRHSSVCHPRIATTWPVPRKCPCKTTYISSAPMKCRALSSPACAALRG